MCRGLGNACLSAEPQLTLPAPCCPPSLPVLLQIIGLYNFVRGRMDKIATLFLSKCVVEGARGSCSQAEVLSQSVSAMLGSRQAAQDFSGLSRMKPCTAAQLLDSRLDFPS